MTICDGHIHLRPGYADDVRLAANAEGAARYSVLTLSQLRADPAENPETLLAKALDPERCFALCSLDHSRPGHPMPDPLTQVKAWLDAGFDGVKFIETKPNCQHATGARLDDMYFDAMFAYLEEHSVPVLWHNGDPATFWKPDECPKWAVENGWGYWDKGCLSLEELYSIVENVLERHPKLKVTFAHFYFVSDDPAHAERMMTRYPNVRFDLTPGTEMYQGFTERADFFRGFFLRYADRIQFGTDTDCDDPAHKYGTKMRDNIMRFLSTDDRFDFAGLDVKGFKLPEDVVEQIMSRTHDSFVGTKPKAIDKLKAHEACLAAAERCFDEKQRAFAVRAEERIAAL